MEDRENGVFVCEACRSECLSERCLTLHQRHLCRFFKGNKRPSNDDVPSHLHIYLHPTKQHQYVKCSRCLINEPGHHSDHVCTLTTSILNDQVLPTDEIWAFDMEAKFDPIDYQVNRTTTIQKLRHEIDLVVASRVYPEQVPEEFQTFPSVEAFLTFLKSREAHLIQIDKHAQIIVFAHNLKGYDGRFIFKEMIRTRCFPSRAPLMRGCKFISIEMGRIKFADFLCHFVNSLDASIKAFGISDRVNTENKLFFPYDFNTFDNANYVGPMPPRESFSPHLMKPGQRDTFYRWYQAQVDQNRVWDHKEQYTLYCQSDVRILREAIRAYNESLIQITTKTPLYSATSPGFARRVWQQCFYAPQFSPAPFKSLRLIPIEHEQYLFEFESVRGGRTDVRVCHFELTREQVRKGWKIKYIDVCSMYPHVMASFPMPLGSPEILLEHHFSTWDEESCSRYFQIDDNYGIAKVDIYLPEPHYLHHPPLVTVLNNKLVASLNPLIEYTATTLELKAAVSVGYRIRKIYRFHKYKKTTEGTNYFRDYVEKFIAIKIQASQTNNAGFKQAAKLMMNSLYGKFLQKPDLEKVFLKHCVSQQDVDQWIDTIREKGLEPCAEAQWLTREFPFVVMQKAIPTDFTFNLQSTHTCTGSMIAAGGRLILWEAMHRLGHRVLYHDTDSIVYVDTNDGVTIPIGSELGEWESEVEPPWEIVEFVALAPKTYAYKKRHSESGVIKYEMRLKGIQLNESVVESITFDFIKSLLQGGDTITVPQLMFQFRLSTQEMYTFVSEKILQFNKDDLKGDLIGMRTVPFGCKHRDVPEFEF